MSQENKQQPPPSSFFTGAKWDHGLIAALYVFIFYVAWIGYLGTDDGVYILDARNRVLDPFLIGKWHGDVRLTMTWPMALGFATLGESELAAALPTLVYTVLTGLTAYHYLVRHVGRATALVAVALLASSPLLAINATSLRIDAVETFYVTASLVACLAALEQRGSIPMLFLSGVLAGLAFVTRPTTVALLFFYGMLFLLGYRIDRRRYLAITAGFLSVWLLESFYYLAGTGNFLYRLGLDFHHDQVVRGGGLIDSMVIAPLKMVFGSHNLGFAYWCLPVAAWQLIQGNGAPKKVRDLAMFLTMFAVVWILTFAAFANKLVLDPRYLAPATVAALVVTALWIGFLIQRGRRRWAVTLTLAFLASHALAIHMENKEFAYAERWLVRLAQKMPEPIYTDPQTAERARFLLELEGLRGHVIPEPAPPGALFLSVPENAARGKYNSYRWDPLTFASGPWPRVEELNPKRKGIGVMLEGLGLRNAFPAHVWRKLNYPNPPIVLLRRP